MNSILWGEHGARKFGSQARKSGGGQPAQDDGPGTKYRWQPATGDR